MKGDESFRKKSKAFIQSSNEVFMYQKVFPTFENFLKKLEVNCFDCTATVYFAECVVFPELGEGLETVLALNDLNSVGFRLSTDKIDLDADHLKLMARKIASYHAVSFAMKIEKNPKLEELAAGLIPFHYKSETQGDLEAYKYLCPLSFKRLFNYVFAAPKYQEDKVLSQNLENLKKRVEDDFLEIMESFLRVDHDFAVILNGDYYRNNVMFKYEKIDGKEVPVDLRMFDFQEVRFATIAVDLSIFMFMHVHAALKPLIWDELLEIYHQNLILSLTKILKCNPDDARLHPYSFDKFINHFKQFAFYGAAVSVLSIPWMASPPEDVQKVQEYFELDMHHPEFVKLLAVCGGDEINERMVDNVKLASEKGYLDIFKP